MSQLEKKARRNKRLAKRKGGELSAGQRRAELLARLGREQAEALQSREGELFFLCKRFFKRMGLSTSYALLEEIASDTAGQVALRDLVIEKLSPLDPKTMGEAAKRRELRKLVREVKVFVCSNCNERPVDLLPGDPDEERICNRCMRIKREDDRFELMTIPRSS